MLARATLTAPSAARRALELGFSDRAIVYLNGRALYRGDDTYRSRDYRFLGSIGWYDTLFLPLDRGSNDLVDRRVGGLRRLGRAGAAGARLTPAPGVPTSRRTPSGSGRS